MDYYASGHSCIRCGQFWIIIGTLLFPLGWYLLSIRGPIEGWLKNKRCFSSESIRKAVIALVIFVLILFGPLFVTKGGTLVTKGWNLLDNHERRKTLISAANLEWIQNEATLLAMEKFLSNDKELTKPILLHTYNSFALNNVAQSYLFIVSENSDFKEIFATISGYMESIAVVNDRILTLNDEVCRNIGSDKRVKKYKAFHNMDLLISFKRKHVQAGKLIASLFKETYQNFPAGQADDEPPPQLPSKQIP